MSDLRLHSPKWQVRLQALNQLIEANQVIAYGICGGKHRIISLDGRQAKIVVEDLPTMKEKADSIVEVFDRCIEATDDRSKKISKLASRYLDNLVKADSNIFIMAVQQIDLKEKSWAYRLNLARLLGKTGNSEATATLVGLDVLCRENDLIMRMAISHALEKSANDSALPLILEYIEKFSDPAPGMDLEMQILFGDVAATITEHSLKALGWITDDAKRIIEFLDHKKPRIQIAAGQALANMGERGKIGLTSSDMEKIKKKMHSIVEKSDDKEAAKIRAARIYVMASKAASLSRCPLDINLKALEKPGGRIFRRRGASG
ncbi:hypothetical protein JXA56_02795 [Candidatus Micrarchaeota archaeon]|nr:hypothetical protein [Candidatus Micrarchaeota archaeon]